MYYKYVFIFLLLTVSSGTGVEIRNEYNPEGQDQDLSKRSAPSQDAILTVLNIYSGLEFINDDSKDGNLGIAKPNTPVEKTSKMNWAKYYGAKIQPKYPLAQPQPIPPKRLNIDQLFNSRPKQDEDVRQQQKLTHDDHNINRQPTTYFTGHRNANYDNYKQKDINDQRLYFYKNKFHWSPQPLSQPVVKSTLDVPNYYKLITNKPVDKKLNKLYYDDNYNGDGMWPTKYNWNSYRKLLKYFNKMYH